MRENEERRGGLLAAERRELIVQAVEEQGKILAAELSRELGVSDDTIRRDLDQLAEEGRIRRVHGGALRATSIAHSYAARLQQGEQLKEQLARATVRLMRHGQVLLLDGGTTTLAVAQQIPHDLQATVVTTSPQVAVALAEHRQLEIIMIGGRLYRYPMVAVGAATVEVLRELRADLCVLGILAIHPEAGLTVVDREEAYVKRAMIEVSASVVAPASATKLGTVASFVVAPLSQVTHLVTEPAVPEEILLPYREAGLTIIQ